MHTRMYGQKCSLHFVGSKLLVGAFQYISTQASAGMTSSLFILCKGGGGIWKGMEHSVTAKVHILNPYSISLSFSVHICNSTSLRELLHQLNHIINKKCFALKIVYILLKL